MSWPFFRGWFTDAGVKSKGKILVIRGGAIGDFILTLPVLAALRTQFPNARLEVLGYPHIASLALAGKLVDDVRSIEARPLAGFFARHGALDAGLGQYFANCALIVSYLYDPDEIFRTNVARCSKAQFLAGPHRPSENARLHATEIFLQPLERLAIFDPDRIPRLVISNASDLEASRPWLAAHPGSGSEKKNWPEKQWASLLETLARETRFNLLLVGGEAEGERLNALSRLWPQNRLKLAQSLPLPQLAGLLQHAAFFVGHDSGITHLAAALGLPGLVLWGESNLDVWRPQSERMTILRDARGLASLPASRVLAELAPALDRLNAGETY
ncbi:MAG: glycosyltransferase family 9 protein [Verrucomicrobiota bacterium]|jgi:heptosyltransferase III